MVTTHCTLNLKMTVPIEKNENGEWSALRSISENLGITTIIDLLRKSRWALDHPFKTIEISDNQAVLSIDRCRTPRAENAC